MAGSHGSGPIPDTEKVVQGSISYFQQTVVLREWWLVKANKCLEGKRISVSLSGFTSRESLIRHQALRVFNSAPIAKRLDDFTLETDDGVVICICGFINRARTTENGFSSKVSDYFSIGFPPCWESCILKCMESMDASGINLQKTACLKIDGDQGKLNSILDTIPSKLKGLKDEIRNEDESRDCNCDMTSASHAQQKSNLSTRPPLFHSHKTDDDISTQQEPSGSSAMASSEIRNTRFSVASEGTPPSKMKRCSANSKENDGDFLPSTSVAASSCPSRKVDLRVAMLSAGKKLRNCSSNKKVVPEKGSSSEDRKMNTTHVISPESLSLKRSRSGRLLLPTLHFWCNQIPLYDADRNFTGIQQEIHPARDAKVVTLDPPRKMPRCPTYRP